MLQAKPKKLRIGDLLVEHGVITQVQLQNALEIQGNTGQKLGRVLVETGALTEDQLLNFLARQLNIELVDLRDFDIEPDVVNLIPEVHARRFRVIALQNRKDGLLLGMADPTDIFAYDEVARIVDRPLRLAVVRESELLAIFDRIYRRTGEISSFAEELGQQLSVSDSVLNTRDSGSTTQDAPVVKLLQTMFEDALQVNASDIHIEPDERELRIRCRIDGVLQVQTTAEPRIGHALLSRLKLMAGLDISEKRLPQDGRFNVRVRDQSIDVRLSTMPQQYGESAVMRMLNQSAGIVPLSQLGMPEQTMEQFRRLIHNPHGIVLVVGPTGSGKTTTLYSALRELNSPEVKIITVEDPVEYRLPGIVQVQVNPRIDLTFARVLRGILRHDPDIALIGEMRDEETMEIGLRTAMTGHLVLSTLHTNDAVGTALRLIDMGAEPYLLAGALRGILAQRLVRRNCEHCARPVELTPAQSAMLRKAIGDGADSGDFRAGSGCSRCNHTGYQGRIGIYELLEIDADLVRALHNGDLQEFSTQAACSPGFRPLRQRAFELAADGVTTVDEVVRVTFGEE